MLIAINDFVRRRHRMITLIACALLAVALLATHSAASAHHPGAPSQPATGGHHSPGHAASGHKSPGHDQQPPSSLMQLCMAVIESALSLTVIAGLALTLLRPRDELRPRFAALPSGAPELAGTGPPSLTLTLHQSFLR